MNVIPHFLYGPGEDALKLTVEYGAVKDDDKTKEVQEMDNNLLICQRNGNIEQLLFKKFILSIYQWLKQILFHVRGMTET